MSKVCIAKILTAHGVRGLVRLDCFLEDPSELHSYNPLHSADGKVFTVKLKNPVKGKWLAEINGISDRTEVEKYRNIELFIDREQLPEADEGFYHLDLVDRDVFDKQQNIFGKILAVENFGAGDLIEIKPIAGKIFYLPFTEPYVTVENDIITIDNFTEFQG